MKVKAIIAGAMMALMAGPALAESKWTGVYVGLHGGYDLTSTEISEPGYGSINGLSGNGTAYGVHIGADYTIPGTKLVLGLGGDYTWSDSEFKITDSGMKFLTAGIDESWAIYGRIGIDAGRVMPYMLAGYTEADVSAALFPGTPYAEKGSDKMKGWLVGGGLEMALYEGITLGFEYRFTKFDTLDVDVGGPTDLKLDTDRHEVRAKLSYKFGGLF
jgi:outer membrane immunogenic protein